jgi:hypothetical protein
MGWATFWAIFSKIHLVTLATYPTIATTLILQLDM